LPLHRSGGWLQRPQSGKARLITSIAIRFIFGSMLALRHTENRPSLDKLRVTPPSSLCNPKVLNLRSAWHSSGANSCREDCLTAARDMTFGRAAGRSKHWASTAGGRRVRACQRPNVSAHTAADRQLDTRGGRPPRHLGEVARNGPMLTVAKSMRDSPRRF
jgi:hypothetical protein